MNLHSWCDMFISYSYKTKNVCYRNSILNLYEDSMLFDISIENPIFCNPSQFHCIYSDVWSNVWINQCGLKCLYVLILGNLKNNCYYYRINNASIMTSQLVIFKYNNNGIHLTLIISWSTRDQTFWKVKRSKRYQKLISNWKQEKEQK